MEKYGRASQRFPLGFPSFSKKRTQTLDNKFTCCLWDGIVGSTCRLVALGLALFDWEWSIGRARFEETCRSHRAACQQYHRPGLNDESGSLVVVFDSLNYEKKSTIY